VVKMNPRIAPAFRGRGFALAVATLAAGFLIGACAPAEDGLSVGDRAPAFELTSTAGDRVALSDFEGRPVLLFFHMAVG
jgi:cytochrome oxidase Cu insertion factor (SCO1/SenC/PrrC family)